ncbi:MAG: PH domain-containing protein [Candidatus Cloacimonetes bacterium]|nr:PH domain-containing protein [Candidatus Cloacimonadota bacterium]
MEIRPDKKLITKSWLILITVTLLIIVFVGILHIIPTLDSEIDFDLFVYYIWRVAFCMILVMFIISAPIMILWIKNLTFNIEQDKIVIQKGILTKVKQNIPFRMITDFMLHRSLYDRWLGIGTIKIQTAGQSQNSNGYEGKMSGLLNWDELHEKLRTALSGSENNTVNITKPVAEKTEACENILAELKKISKIIEERKDNK